MKTNQKFTPKYWVAHDPKIDDVYITTLSKSRDKTQEKAIELLGGSEKVFYKLIKEEKLEIILVEIKQVKL